MVLVSDECEFSEIIFFYLGKGGLWIDFNFLKNIHPCAGVKY